MPRWWLAEAGYDPVYGARPLKRVIQRELESVLARRLLGGEIPEGMAVHVDARDKKLVLESQPADLEGKI